MLFLSRLGNAARRRIRGAAYVEYVLLLMMFGLIAVLAVNRLLPPITSTFSSTSLLSDPTIATAPPGGGESGGPSAPLGAPTPSDITTISEDGSEGTFCPEPGWNWTWDRFNRKYRVPGAAHPHPILAGFNRITTFGGPGEQYGWIPVDPAQDYNWWGDYYGITFFIWDTWEHTARIEARSIDPPGEDCDSVARLAGAVGGIGRYGKWGPDSTTDPDFKHGTPGFDTLDLDNGGYEGVIAYQSADTIDDTEGSEIIIPGKGDDEFESDGGGDTYVYALGDGNDVYRSRSGPEDDRLAIMGATIDRIGIELSDNVDMDLVMPDGDRLNLEFQYYDNADDRISEFIVGGSSFSHRDLRNMRVARQRDAGGEVVGSEVGEDHFYRASRDGSYVLDEFSNYDRSDTLTFAESRMADLEFRVTDGESLRIDFPDGDTLYVDDEFNSGYEDNYGIDTYIFADGTRPDRRAIRDKAANDAKIYDEIHLTERSETIRHAASRDTGYSLRSFSNADETDRLVFTETPLSEARFSNDDDFEDLTIAAGGDEITLEDQLDKDPQARVEAVAFPGGVIGLDDQLAKLHADAMKAGHVTRTRLSDTLVYSASKYGDVEIDSIGAEGYDTLKFAETPSTDVGFRHYNGDLTVILPGGAEVGIEDGLRNPANGALSAPIAFAGASLSLDRISTRAATDALDRGDETVYLTGYGYANDIVYSASEHGDVEIEPWSEWTEGIALTFSETRRNEAALSRNGNDLSVKTPDGDVVALGNFFTDNTGEGRIVFSDGAVSMSDIMSPGDLSEYPDAVDPDTWLILTDAADTAELDGHEGALGKDGDDTIDGTDAGESFIGAGGDDTIAGDGGNDTYIFRPGDGDDFYTDFDYNGGNSDRLSIPGADPDAVTITRGSSDTDDAVIALAGGGSVTIQDQFAPDRQNAIEEFAFADSPVLSDRDLRERMLEEAKATGSVVGTDLGETYHHYASDGAYTITDEEYRYFGGTHIDTLRMHDADPDDVTFRRTYNGNSATEDLALDFADAERVILKNALDPYLEHGFEKFVFADGTELDRRGIRQRLMEDSKATGQVVGTDRAETYRHYARDGSYTVRDEEYRYFGGTHTDRLIFEDIASDEVSIRQTLDSADEGTEDIALHTPDGDTVTLLEALDGGENQIEQVSFSDGTVLDEQELRNRMVADMKPTGIVAGSDFAESYTHTTGDGSYSIRDEEYRYFSGTHTDTLTFTDADLATTTIYRSGTLASPGDGIVIRIAGGEEVTLREAMSDREFEIEQVVFQDATLTPDALRTRLLADMARDKGVAPGSDLGETYTYSSGIGSFIIRDYTPSYISSTDALVMEGVARADLEILGDTSSEDIVLRVDTGDGTDEVRMEEGLYSSTDRVETVALADATLTGDEVANAAQANPL